MPGVERCAAYQRAVHVRQARQLARIGWIDTAAILDSDAPSDWLVKQLDQQSADELVRFLRLSRRGRLAGADRPDRFIGNNTVDDLI